MWTNANFGAWYLPKKKSPPTEDFNFADKKAGAHEVVRMHLQEGASLSCLGRLSFDSTSGAVKMTSLTAVVAGGIAEATRYLNLQIRHARIAMTICGGLATMIFFSLFCSVYKSRQEMQRQQAIQDLLNSIKEKKNQIASADEMGVECRICMADPSNVILVPCHHLSICYNCYVQMKDAN